MPYNCIVIQDYHLGRQRKDFFYPYETKKNHIIDSNIVSEIKKPLQFIDLQGFNFILVNLTDIFSNTFVSDLKRIINLADELDDKS